MSVQLIPIGMDLSGAAQERHEMIVECIEQLQNFAHRAKVKGKRNDEVVVVCIKVDSKWRPIVDALMPNYDWQPIRDRGQEPVARGTAMFPICEVIAEKLPDLTNVLLEKPTDGYYKCIALDDGGGTVYEIEPIEQLVN